MFCEHETKSVKIGGIIISLVFQITNSGPYIISSAFFNINGILVDFLRTRLRKDLKPTGIMYMSADNDNFNNEDDVPENGVAVKTRTKTKKPSMYKVLMLNDDYTPMEFVIHVLERFFNKAHEEATQIMLHVHQKGVGTCGIYTYEIAETKVNQTMDLAQQHQHPLQCTIEKD